MSGPNPIKLQVVYDTGRTPDEIIAIAPFRDKLVIATRGHLILMEHDEEADVKLRQLAVLHGRELL